MLPEGKTGVVVSERPIAVAIEALGDGFKCTYVENTKHIDKEADIVMT